MKLRLLSAALVSTALVLAACGGGDDDGGGDTTQLPALTTPAGSGATGEQAHNDADVTFAQGMIAHHQQAIEMAEIALDPTRRARSEVVDLAGRISEAQGGEIAQMTAWLESWDEPVTMDTSGGHDMSSMEGMMTAEDMDTLATLTGPDFDTTWLEMMIAHHEGAIAQSETVLAEGGDAEARSLAERIISAQQGEIEAMQTMLAG